MNILIDFADSMTCSIRLAARPKNTAAGISVGVDSIHNVSGAQTGAPTGERNVLDWNSGYVMAKLEGNSSVSNQPICHAIILGDLESE
jgi:hypothetical protein